MMSNIPGLANQSVENGRAEKKFVRYIADDIPYPPKDKRNFANSGVIKRKGIDNKPKARLQRQSRGSSRRFARGPTIEI
jgi:hypothetical protein